MTILVDAILLISGSIKAHKIIVEERDEADGNLVLPPSHHKSRRGQFNGDHLTSLLLVDEAEHPQVYSGFHILHL